MSIRPISGGYEPLDMDSVIALERPRRLQTTVSGAERSIGQVPPPPTTMRRAQFIAHSDTSHSLTDTATTTVTTTDANAGATLTGVLDLSPTSSNGGAAVLLAANDASASGAGDVTAAAAGPAARPDQIALYELLLADPLLQEVAAAYCPDTPTSLPPNATTDALVAQYGLDLTCRLLQASNAIAGVFADYCAAMDQAATQGPDGGGSGWVFTPGTAGQGDCDGTPDRWDFHPEIFTADYAKGDSLAARAFASFHGDDGSFAQVTRTLCGTSDAGEVYTVTTGGIDPASAQFKWQDLGDGGGQMRWEGARMGHNALVQIDLNDPLEMFDPKAVWFDPRLGFVTANENIVPENSWAETVVITAVIGIATWGVGSAICTAYGVTNAIAVGAVMGATGSVIGGLFQNGTVHFEDVVRGAVVGAVMGAVSQKLDGIGVDAETGAVTDWGARIGAISGKATIQGILAELTGGEFKDAFGQGFATSLAAEVGRSINAQIDAAIDAKTITAEQAASYRTLGRAVTTAIKALADPDADPVLANFAQAFLGDTINAEFTLPSAGGTGNTASNTADTQDDAVELDFSGVIDETFESAGGGTAGPDGSATTGLGATTGSGLTEREWEGIEQSDDILARRGDELAEANGLNPVRLPDGRLQYPDGRILTPGGEVVIDASQDAGSPSAYPSQFRHIDAVAGVSPQGDLTRASDLPMLAAELTPILADGRPGTGVPYRDEAGRVFYRTFDADGNEVRLLSATAAAAPLPLADAARAMAPAAAILLNAERTMGPWPLRIAAGTTLAGTAWLIAQDTDGIFNREALSPEQLRDGQSPLINVPVSPGPAGTPGYVVDNRDTSTPGYEVTRRPHETSTTTPIVEQAWEDLIVDAGAPKWVLVNGVPYRTDLAEHLTGPDGFKGGRLFGSHNLEVAISLLQGSNYWLAPTGTPGIYELNYDYLDSSGTRTVASPPKTVYDPAVISDQAMLDAATRAGDQAWASYTAATGAKPLNYIVVESGIKFQVYINTDSQGNAYVGNVHPIR